MGFSRFCTKYLVCLVYLYLYPLSHIVPCPLSPVRCPLSAVSCPLLSPVPSCHLSPPVPCPLSPVTCPLLPTPVPCPFLPLLLPLSPAPCHLPCQWQWTSPRGCSAIWETDRPKKYEFMNAKVVDGDGHHHVTSASSPNSGLRNHDKRCICQWTVSSLEASVRTSTVHSAGCAMLLKTTVSGPRNFLAEAFLLQLSGLLGAAELLLVSCIQ